MELYTLPCHQTRPTPTRGQTDKETPLVCAYNFTNMRSGRGWKLELDVDGRWKHTPPQNVSQDVDPKHPQDGGSVNQTTSSSPISLSCTKRPQKTFNENTLQHRLAEKMSNLEKLTKKGEETHTLASNLLNLRKQ
uniref:Uncharacterized protein n=1 Tax=Noctiluca scintillans TaxID=2966 RepID=A0A7S0ZUI7_NOCSC|mmetsp:Transcript_19243/g.51412  ORF Transcript_19243/g.51412 Transcript_19243/m.51412 type:complete len:135 (+) Transcript_19243:241-645(+)